MPRLKSANFAVTELATGIEASANSLVVADASLFPAEGPFMILVHDSTPGFTGVKEIMEVGSINKNTNTLSDILRGRENTSPVAHSAGARVECVWTAGTHGELVDTDIKSARFVIGTSTAGWTAADCDYLCDGTADDVEIIQALNDLPATGGEIVILDGTYNIMASINIPKDNVSIRGNGNATILKRMYNSTNTGSGPTAGGLITLNEKSGCKIQGLQIDGNRATYTKSDNSGIRLSSSSNNNTVTGNTCNNNSYGIYLSSSSNNTVTGNTCYNNDSYGIYLYSSSNNTVTGNTCNNNYYGIRLYSSNSNNTVTGNTCYNNVYSGIYLYSSNSNNTVTGNTCNNNDSGIYLSSSSDNTITGNTCNNNNDYGISLSLSSDNTVTGNTCIRGTGTPEDYTTNQHTILLSGTGNNYNLISSNNCMGKAVVISGGTGNSAWGNKFDNTDDLP